MIGKIYLNEQLLTNRQAPSQLARIPVDVTSSVKRLNFARTVAILVVPLSDLFCGLLLDECQDGPRVMNTDKREVTKQALTTRVSHLQDESLHSKSSHATRAMVLFLFFGEERSTRCRKRRSFALPYMLLLMSFSRFT